MTGFLEPTSTHDPLDCYIAVRDLQDGDIIALDDEGAPDVWEVRHIRPGGYGRYYMDLHHTVFSITRYGKDLRERDHVQLVQSHAEKR